MELGITGHLTRGNEVIEILEMLGGKNSCRLNGNQHNYFYYIGDKTIYDKIIYNSYIGPDEINGYKILSLDDFLKEFPYKVGDKVKVWVNHEHFGGTRAELEEAEIYSMRWNAGRCEVAYRMKVQTGEFYIHEIKGKANDEEQKIDPTIDYAEIVQKSYEEKIGNMCAEITMDTIVKTVATFEYLKDRGYNLQEGYHFADENGNVINAKQIRLVKNEPYYPKTYEECCDIIGYHLEGATIIGYKTSLLRDLQKLLVCRDAYWEIAGEYLELGEAWKPDFCDDSTKFNIYRYENKIILNDNQWSNKILVFPTKEMRDAFYENFKELIERCKEVL